MPELCRGEFVKVGQMKTYLDTRTHICKRSVKKLRFRLLFFLLQVRGNASFISRTWINQDFTVSHNNPARIYGFLTIWVRPSNNPHKVLFYFSMNSKNPKWNHSRRKNSDHNKILTLLKKETKNVSKKKIIKKCVRWKTLPNCYILVGKSRLFRFERFCNPLVTSHLHFIVKEPAGAYTFFTFCYSPDRNFSFC